MKLKMLLSFGLVLFLMQGLSGQESEQKKQLQQLYDSLENIEVYNEEVLDLAQRVLSLAETLGDTDKLGDAQYEFSQYYYHIGDYETALKEFQKLYELGIAFDNSYFIYDACLGMGDTYLSLRLDDEAMMYFEKARELYPQVEDQRYKFDLICGIGGYYMNKKKFKEALTYFTESREIAKAANDTVNLKIANSNMALCYSEMGQGEAAVSYQKEILVYDQETKDSLEFAISYANLAYAYQQAGQFKQAFALYDSSLFWSRKFALDETTFLTYLDIAEAYEAKADFDRALLFQKKYQSLKDSVFNYRKKRQINNLEIKFQSSEKERKLLLKDKEVIALQNTRERLYFFIFGLLGFIMVGSLYYLKARESNRRKLEIEKINTELSRSLLKNKELEAQKLEKELKNKQGDLTNLALDIARKNEFSNQLAEELDSLQKEKTETIKLRLREIILFIANHLRISEDLALLQTNVEQINQAFYRSLDEQFGNLSSNDKYVLGLIRLNLSNKDIAAIKGISVGSAKVTRHRLRKKLNLSPEVDFTDFLQKL